jgi:hypothetical protein
MTMEEIQSGSPPEGRELSQALVELQNLRFSVVNGAAADTNITLTGFTWGTDTVAAVLYYPVSGGNVTSVSDLTAELQAPTGSPAPDAAFQIATTVTTGGKLVVVWFDKQTL